MMNKLEPDYKIIVPSRLKMGTFVNAFRVLPDVGDEFFLDFCVYSQQEKEATLISRLRVHKAFLGLILEHLDQTFQDLNALADISDSVVLGPFSMN